MMLEDKEQKKIWVCDMLCPQQRNIETMWVEKLTKYQQLALEMREGRPGYEIVVVPVVIGALGDGMEQAMKDIGKIFANEELVRKTAYEMQKTVLKGSETTTRKVLSGLIQELDE